MAFPNFISTLRGNLSPQAQILTNPSHIDFQHSLQRWSNIDLQVPGAIVKPASEADAAETVRLAALVSLSSPTDLWLLNYR